MLFGNRQYDVLPETIRDIVERSPRAELEWDEITRQIQAAALHKNKKTFREVMKRYGFPLAAITTMYGALGGVKISGPAIRREGTLIRQFTTSASLH